MNIIETRRLATAAVLLRRNPGISERELDMRVEETVGLLLRKATRVPDWTVDDTGAQEVLIDRR